MQDTLYNIRLAHTLPHAIYQIHIYMYIQQLTHDERDLPYNVPRTISTTYNTQHTTQSTIYNIPNTTYNKQCTIHQIQHTLYHTQQTTVRGAIQ